ncbi:MAG: Fic family protein [Muribaculaceae bacterium]|nr:Fic family protein [Muribaculaceae bacterium]
MKRSQKHNGYIWQQPNWPHFRWDAAALLEPMSRLSRMHGQLNGQMSMLGFNEKSHSLLSAMTDELISSSEIEGVMLNPNSVRSSIARRLGIENDGLLAEDHYVEGLVDVMLDAIRNCRSELTAERLFAWHVALKVHYEAPPSGQVPAEMEQLIEWCNNADQSPFIMAAVAHLWFVTIHPFDDGNGRISRTLADMLLGRLDEDSARYYSMSAEINRNKKAYYEILEQTQKGDLNITQWLLWFFGCLENAIKRASATVERTLQKAAYWDKFRQTDVNERQRKVLNRLWDGFEGKLTTSKWAKICSCSQDTALRDINDLISKGMLRNSGEGGRSANYLLGGEND